MIAWCSYCQSYMGERAPYDDASFTHSICAPCFERLDCEAEELIEETELPRSLVRDLIAHASAGDEQKCERAIQRARSAGVDETSILVGVLQPLLYETGRAWANSTASIADEHRVSSWVERTLAQLRTPPKPAAGLDMLFFQAPGNSHTIGPRFAVEVLVRRGFSAVALYPDLPVGEISREIEVLRPRLVGVSCAIPSQIAPARELVATLAPAAPPSCRFILGGQAFRSAPEAWAGEMSVAITVEEIASLLGDGASG